MSFTVLPSGTPDVVDVELLLAGAVDDEQARAAIHQAMEGELAHEAADLEAFRAEWSRLAPPLRTATPPPANRGWMASAFAAAAFTLLAVGLARGPAPDDHGVRPMGALPVDSWVERPAERAGATDYRAGDRIFVQLTPPTTGFVSVAMLNEDGSVTLFHRSAQDQPIEAGKPFSLDGALLLDDDSTREWLIVTLNDRWQSERATKSAVRSMLPEPARHVAPDVWIAEVTRGR